MSLHIPQEYLNEIKKYEKRYNQILNSIVYTAAIACTFYVLGTFAIERSKKIDATPVNKDYNNLEAILVPRISMPKTYVTQIPKF